MATMRTVKQDELGGPEVLKVVETERPEPGVGEILVKVHAAGLNPVDWKTRAYGGLLGRSGDFTLGWDVSGTVAAVGFGVRLYEVGDEVYGMPRFPQFANAYSEYVTAPARHFARKPEGLTHSEAAALPSPASPPTSRWSTSPVSKRASGSSCTPAPEASATWRCRSRKPRARM